jgi:subtilisin family serine protease
MIMDVSISVPGTYHPVMRCDGRGNFETMISAIKVIKSNDPSKLSVISMSINIPDSLPLSLRRVFSLLYATTPLTLTCAAQVRTAISSGIPCIVKVGSGQDDEGNTTEGIGVKGVSPGRVTGAITVGATTIKDTFAFFSNFGDKVNFLAPGDEILSASNDIDDAIMVAFSTSQAA